MEKELNELMQREYERIMIKGDYTEQEAKEAERWYDER